MKKFTSLTFLLFMFVIVAKSQTLNNPKDADGYYIVNWSCTNNN
jgi:hypothetical protein